MTAPLKQLHGDARWTRWVPTADEAARMRETCPWCRSGPGDRCRKPGGQIAARMHKDRRAVRR